MPPTTNGQPSPDAVAASTVAPEVTVAAVPRVRRATNRAVPAAVLDRHQGQGGGHQQGQHHGGADGLDHSTHHEEAEGRRHRAQCLAVWRSAWDRWAAEGETGTSPDPAETHRAAWRTMRTMLG